MGVFPESIISQQCSQVLSLQTVQIFAISQNHSSNEHSQTVLLQFRETVETRCLFNIYAFLHRTMVVNKRVTSESGILFRIMASVRQLINYTAQLQKYITYIIENLKVCLERLMHDH